MRNDKSNARLGVVASKKILPSAVQRNHFKRVIREAFRQHSIKTKQIDLVVMARSADLKHSQPNDLDTLFRRVQIKCASL